QVRPIRLYLDVNVWVSHLLALQNNRTGTAGSELVSIVAAMSCPAGPVQLVASWRTLATLEDVLVRIGFGNQEVLDFSASLVGLMKAGPESFDPHLLPEGGGH